MHPQRISVLINTLVTEDSRFSVKAYYFVLHSLDYLSGLDESPPLALTPKHLSCHEFLLGFTQYCLNKFGPMASTVMKEWGIMNSYHVGEIVFNLVKVNILGKQESDSLEDFKSYLDLHSALTAPFQNHSTKAKP